jgi:hypothetical protein
MLGTGSAVISASARLRRPGYASMLTATMPEPEEKAPEVPRKRRRWKRWTFLVLLLLLTIGLVVLNGPGWRWIAGYYAGRYLPELGLTGTVNFEGTLSNGEVLLKGVDLKGDGALRQVKLDQIVLRYRPGKIIRGEVESVRIDGLHADLDLARPWLATPREPKEQKVTDLAQLSETLRSLRQRIVPVQVDVSDLQVRITNGSDPVFSLASMDLEHAAGADRFELKLGELGFPSDQVLPPQETAVVWAEESLSLEKAQLMPGLAVEAVQVGLPADGALTYQAALLANAARFEADGSLESGQVKLAEGTLSVAEVERILGMPIPAQGVLEAFALDVRDLQGGLATLDATASAQLRDAAYEEWRVPILNLSGTLDGDSIAVDGTAEALGSSLEIATKAQITRTPQLWMERAEAKVDVRDAAAVLSDLRGRIPDLEPLGEVPVSSAVATATAVFEQGGISRAEGRVILTPADVSKATPLELSTSWEPAGSLDATLVVDGAKVDARFDFRGQRYGGKAGFASLTPERLQPWLGAFGIEVPQQMQLTGSWQGEGEFGPANHQGRGEIANFTFNHPGQPEVVASAQVVYAWPASFEVIDLLAVQGTQKIAGDAKLSDQLLTLDQLQWTDGADVLLDGKASIPVTENPVDWKGLLKQTRPLSINLESRELAFYKLHPFLPETTRFPDSARGKVILKVSGTPAEPVINGEIVMRDLGLQSQAEIPKADIDLLMATSEGFFNVEGTLMTPGYPAANLKARLPFRPGVWVENPEVLDDEKLEASASVPNLELSRFAALVPSLKTLSGSLRADVFVGGTLGKPEPRGEVELKAGKVELKDEQIPAMSGIALKATATPAGIDLPTLAMTMDGGTVSGGGRLSLIDGKPDQVDFSLRGRTLPVKRDESMIIRANADLTLRGAWETATLSGTIFIVDSLFYRDIELLPIGVPFNQPAAPSVPAIDVAKRDAAASSIPEPFRNWPLSVRVRTANAFLIRGNLANGQAILDVNVTGTAGSPEPRGKATIREVTAKLPFSTLVVEEGTVDFRPDAPFDPTLNIRGRSVIRPYEVNVYVYGPVSDPEVLTTSSPPLPESEIMTLLATGTTTSGITDPQAATTRGAQLLIEEFRRGRIRYARRLQPLLKVLDRVDFQVGEQNRYSGQKYNSATINLDDNWLISAGVGEEGNSRVTLMYLLRFK